MLGLAIQIADALDTAYAKGMALSKVISCRCCGFRVMGSRRHGISGVSVLVAHLS